MRVLTLVLLGSLSLGIFNQAQGATLTDQRNRLLEIFSGLHDERLLDRPGRNDQGFEARVSLSVIPNVDTSVGTKDEQADFSPVIPRPGVKYSYKGFFGQLAGTPEVSAFGVTTQGLTVKGGYGLDSRFGLFTAWASYSTGRIEAPIASPSSGIDDVLGYDISNVNLSYGYTLPNVTPFITIGTTRVRSNFEVRSDNTTADIDTSVFSYSLGAYSRFYDNYTVSAEVAVLPNIIVNPRINFGFIF